MNTSKLMHELIAVVVIVLGVMLGLVGQNMITGEAVVELEDVELVVEQDFVEEVVDSAVEDVDVVSGNVDGLSEIEMIIEEDEMGVSEGSYPSMTADIDYVQVNYIDSPNIIYFNDGDATFTLHQNMTIFNWTRAIVIGDLDNDGDLDFITGNDRHDWPNYVYVNDGEGNFTYLLNTTDLDNTHAMAIGDLNNDGYLDHITGNWGDPNRVYINNGTGGFTLQDSSSGSHVTSDIAIADFDNDGDLDYVACNDASASTVQIYDNDGTGDFTLTDTIDAFNYCISVSVGDLDNDKDIDIVFGTTHSSETNGNDTVFLNDGTGQFSYFMNLTRNETTMASTLGDIDNDGDLDYVQCVFTKSRLSAVFKNNGTGGLFRTSYISDGPIIDCALADLDNDGDLDYLGGKAALDNIILNDGTGYFSESSTNGGGVTTYAVGLGDLDGDGYMVETNCFDGIDNDFDGWMDIWDIDCQNGSRLRIWDETDRNATYGNLTRFLDETIRFYANYTNSSDYLLSADCRINFSDSVDNVMNWNATTSLYEYTRTFTPNGIYDYNVTCKKADYMTLTGYDNVTVSAPPPNVTLIFPNSTGNVSYKEEGLVLVVIDEPYNQTFNVTFTNATEATLKWFKDDVEDLIYRNKLQYNWTGSYLEEGVYIIRANVSTDGGYDGQHWNLTVQNVNPNNITTIYPNFYDTVGGENRSINTSIAEPDDKIFNITFENESELLIRWKVDGVEQSAYQNSSEFVWYGNYEQEGSYIILAEIRNLAGTDSQEWNLTVNNTPIPSVELITPINNSIAMEGDITFRCNASIDGAELVNITFYNNLNGSWVENGTIEVSGTENSSVMVRNISEFLPDNALSDKAFRWNCLSYGDANHGAFASSNATFSSWDLGNYPMTAFNASLLSIVKDNVGDVFLMHADGAQDSTIFNDSLGRHVIRAIGQTHVNASHSRIGSGAVKFDSGSGTDYLNISDSSDWTFGNEDFTIDMWVKRGDFGRRQGLMGQTSPSGAGSATSFWIEFQSNDYLYASVYTGSWREAVANVKVLDTDWHHIAFTREYQTLYLFIDGVLVDTQTATGTVLDSSENVGIGVVGERGDFFFEGLIDEVHVTKGKALWTQNFTPPNQEYYDWGYYESRVFTMDNWTDFKNITWDEDVNKSLGNITFNVRTCSLAGCNGREYQVNCSNSSLCNLDDISYGQYFQYKVNFESDDENYTPKLLTESVSIGHEPAPVGPEIQSVTVVPQKQGLGSLVNFTANITDVHEDVQSAWIEVSVPGEGRTNYTMWNVSETAWVLDNFTDYSNGTYNFTIYANDSEAHQSNDTGTFVMYSVVSGSIMVNEVDAIYERKYHNNFGYISGDTINLAPVPEVNVSDLWYRIWLNYSSGNLSLLQKTKKHVDIIWVVDTTSSMDNYINGKSWNAVQITGIKQGIGTFLAQFDDDTYNLTLSLFTYKDNESQQNFVGQTDSKTEFTNWIEALEVEGGGQYPGTDFDENPYLAMHTVMNESLSPINYTLNGDRFLYLFTDAGAHTPDDPGLAGDDARFNKTDIDELAAQNNFNIIPVTKRANTQLFTKTIITPYKCPPFPIAFGSFGPGSKIKIHCGFPPKPRQETYSITKYDFNYVELARAITSENDATDVGGVYFYQRSTGRFYGNATFLEWTNQSHLTVQKMIEYDAENNNNSAFPPDLFNNTQYNFHDFNMIIEKAEHEGEDLRPYLVYKFALEDDGSVLWGENTSFVRNSTIFMFYPNTYLYPHIYNNETTDTALHLLMRLEYYNSTTSQYENISVARDDNTSREIPGQSFLGLGSLWEGIETTDESLPDGKYRATVAATDENDVIANVNNGSSIYTYSEEFNITTEDFNCTIWEVMSNYELTEPIFCTTVNVFNGAILNISGEGSLVTAELNVIDSSQITGQTINITASEIFVENDSVINASIKGYRGGTGGSSDGTGPGAGQGTTNGGGGAGHGGEGGRGQADGGGPYGSSITPITLGSGGGSGVRRGGNGGGRIRIIADSVELNGTITADGQVGYGPGSGNNYAGGGGAGGSIWIRTQNLTGIGSITADGGDGGAGQSSYDGGGGGGGRVAVYYNYTTWNMDDFLRSNTSKGLRGGSTERDGEDGTLIFIDEDDNTAVISDGFRWQGDCVAGWEYNLSCEHTSTVFYDAQIPGVWNFTNLTIIDAENLVGNMSMFNVTVTDRFEMHDVRWDENDGNESFFTVSDMIMNMTTMVGDDFIFNLDTIDGIYGSNLTLVEIDFEFNEPSSQELKIEDSSIEGSMAWDVGVLVLDADSVLSANGTGHQPRTGTGGDGRGPGGGTGELYGGAGGAYGGRGGDSLGGTTGAPTGPYGSSLTPRHLGSAGGNGQAVGGAGAGYIILSAEHMRIEGVVMANGDIGIDHGSNGGGGGGSGGGIWINAGNLTGDGLLIADGGKGGNGGSSKDGGGGGGGRIAVYYNITTWDFGDFLNCRVYGGQKGSGTEEDGYNGTMIFIDEDDNSAFITQGFRFQNTTGRNNETVSTSYYIDGAWNFTNLTIYDANNVISNVTMLNITVIDTFEMWNVSWIHDGALLLINASDIQSRDSYVEADDMNITAEDVLLENSTFEANTIVDAPVVVIDGNSLLNSSAAGYLNGIGTGADGYGPGAGTGGANGGAGGSYGGLGGDALGGTTGAPTSVYGSSLAPGELGSAGGNGQGYGGRGGGRVKIISEHLRLDGNITSVGGRGNDHGGNGAGGGGSGGSIWIIVENLTGSGRMIADGGIGGDGTGAEHGGGGGGGRVAVYYNYSTWDTGNFLRSSARHGYSVNDVENAGSDGSAIFVDSDDRVGVFIGGFRFQDRCEGGWEYNHTSCEYMNTTFYSTNEPSVWNFTNLKIMDSYDLVLNSSVVLIEGDIINISNITVKTSSPGHILHIRYDTFNDWNTNYSDFNMMLEKNGVGWVRWDGTINASNLSSYVSISDNRVYVESGSRWDGGANITLYDVPYATPYPFVSADDVGYVPCTEPACFRLSASQSEFLFNVTGFSSYAAGPDSYLGVYDDTDSAERNTGDLVMFYANYSNSSTVEPIFGAGVYCDIMFNLSDGWVGNATMEYNAANELYEYNRTFSVFGEYDFNVLCNGSSMDYYILNTTDNFIISNSGPMIVLVSPVNGSRVASTSVEFICNASNSDQLTNISLYVWNSTGLYFNDTAVVSGVSNESNWTLAGMTADDYNWNCRSYDNYDTEGWADDNYTVTLGSLLNISLVSHTTKQNVTQYEFFKFSVNVSCTGFDCNFINVSLDPWWDNDWGYRREVGVINTAGNLADYQMKIELNLTEYNNTGKIMSNCSDIRFTDSGSTKLDYWIEHCNVSGHNSTVWVKVPSVADDATTTIYMYYGNADAVSESNGTATFIFHRGVGTFDLDEVHEIRFSGRLTESINSDGHLVLGSSGGSTVWQYNVTDYVDNLTFRGMALRGKMRRSSGATSSSTFGILGFFTSASAPKGYQIADIGSDNDLKVMRDWNNNLAGDVPSPGSDWFTGELKCDSDGSTISLTVDDSTTVSGSHTQYVTMPISAQFGTGGQGTTFEYILVRNYTTPEPNFTIGAEEEAAAGKSLVSNVDGALPFYTNISNPYTLNLSAGEHTLVEWWVNASGVLSSTHVFYADGDGLNDTSIDVTSATVNLTIAEAPIPPPEQAPNITAMYPNSTGVGRYDAAEFVNVSIVEPANQTFNITFTNNSYVLIRWFVDGVENTGVENSSSYLFVGSYSTAGEYSVMVNVSNSVGSDSRYWNLTVNDTELLLNVTLVQPLNNSIYLRGNVTYACNASTSVGVIENITLYHDMSGDIEANGTFVCGGSTCEATFVRNPGDFIDDNMIYDTSYPWTCYAVTSDNRNGYAPANATFSGWDLGNYTNATLSSMTIVLEEYSFSDDFESGSTGSAPPGWDTANSPTVEVDPQDGGNQAVRLNTDGERISKELAPIDNAVMQMRVMQTSGDSLMWYVKNGTLDAVYMQMKDDGHFNYYYSGTGWTNLPTDTTWSGSTWYNVTVVANVSASNYTIYIDGVNKGTVPFAYDGITNGLRSIYAYQNFGGRTGYVDDVVFYGVDDVHEVHGVYESDVKNATFTATWINLTWDEEVDKDEGNITVSARSCDDGACDGESYTVSCLNFSYCDLSSLSNNQYFQYRIEFETENNSYTPQFVTESITIKYEPYSNSVPVIGSISDAPDPQGFGGNVTISADITDADGQGDISVVMLEVVGPDGSVWGNNTMTAVDADTWRYDNYSDYENGSYTYTVHVNDSAGEWASSSGSFLLAANLSVDTRLTGDNYSTGEIVSFMGYAENENAFGEWNLGASYFSSYYSRAKAMAFDSNKSIFVVGGNILKKFYPNGTEDTSWDKTLGGSNIQLTSVAVDSNDSVYIVGGGQDLYTSYSNDDWLIKKFFANGTEDDVNWNKSISTAISTHDEMAHAIAIDSNDSVYVAGDNYDSTSGVFYYWGIYKYDSDGNYIDNKTIDVGNLDDHLYDIAIDSDDEIIMVGTKDQLDVNSDLDQEWLVYKYSSDFAYRWSKEFTNEDGTNGQMFDDVPFAVAVDSNDDIYVAGYRVNKDEPGDGEDKDWWIKKINSTGTEDTENWDKVLNFSGVRVDDEARSLYIYDGGIYVVGFVDKPPGVSGGEWQIKKYDANGTEDPAWNLTRYPGRALSVLVNGSDVYIAGTGESYSSIRRFNTSVYTGSKVINHYDLNTSAYLYYKIQYWNAGTWVDQEVILDENNSRRILAGDLLNVSSILPAWDSSANTYGAGLYRTYFAATDEDNNAIVDTFGNAINSTNNFTLYNDTSIDIGIRFVDPTLANASGINVASAEVNISMQNVSDLENFVWNWDGLNYTPYNDSLRVMMNFDNVSAVSDNTTHAADIGGYGYHGKFDGDPQWNCSDKRYGCAIKFDGDDFLDLGDNLFNSVQRGAVAFWVKADSWPSEHPIFYVGDDSEPKQFISFGLRPEGPRFQAYSDPAFNTRITGNATLSLNEWYFLVFVSDGSNYYVYKDGELLQGIVDHGTDTGEWIGDIGGGTKDYYVGKWDRSTSGPFYFNGTLDELKIYERVLSADEVLQLYMSNLKRYDADRWIFYANQSNLSDAQYSYYGYVADENGNENITETRYITVDSNAPTINLRSPDNHARNTTSNNIVFVYNATDVYDIENCSLFVNGVLNQTNSSINQSIEYDVHVYLDNGQYNWSVNCTDSSGNVGASYVYNITVDVDLIVPGIEFVYPTSSNASNSSATSLGINISVTEENLENFVWNWDGVDYNFYDNDLILMMNFDNRSSLGESSTYAVDVSGYGNNGNLRGQVEYTTGRYGTGLGFAGTDNRVDIPDSGLWNFGNDDFTIEMWINLNDITSDQFLIGQEFSPTSTAEDWKFIFRGTGLGIEIDNYDGASHVIRVSQGDTSGWSTGTWYHTAVVRNGNNFVIYRNGDVVASGSDTTAMPDYSGYLQIGGYNTTAGAGQWVNGKIDEVRIWDRSLSAAEVTQHYYSSLNKYDTDRWIFYTGQGNISDGSHTYSAYTNDSTGNDNNTETRYVTFDATAPNITIDEPDPLEVVGWSVQLRASVNDSGVGVEAQWYEIVNSSWQIVNGSVFDGSAVWNTNNDSYPDGNYTFVVHGNDSLGNVNSTNVTFTLDNTKPGVQLYIPEMSYNKLDFNMSAFVSNTHLNYTYYTINDSSGGLVQNNTVYIEARQYNWTELINVTLLGDDNYTFTVYAQDIVGNNNTKNTWFIVDTTNGTISYNPSTVDDSANVSADNVLVNVTCEDANREATMLNWQGTDEVFATSLGNMSWSTKAGLTEGGYSFYAWCNDSVGNSKRTATRTFTVDLSSPTVSLESPVDDAYNTTSNSIVFVYNASENLTAVESCSLFVDGVLNQTDGTVTNNQLNEFASVYLDNGQYNWNVTCTDTVGRVGASATYNVTIFIDTFVPVVTLVSPVDAYKDSDGTVTLSCSATNHELANITSYGNWSGSFVENETEDVSGVENGSSFTLNGIADGTYSWSCGASDSSGNYAFAAENRTFMIDSTAPSVVLESPENNSALYPGVRTFRYNASDANGVENCSLVLNELVNDTDDSISLQNTFSVDLGLGQYNWSVNCTDSFGNNRIGDTWNLTIIPIPNLAPNTTEVLVNSSTGSHLTGENVTCYAKGEDALQDTLNAYYRWYVNESLIVVSGNNSVSIGSLELVSILTSDNTGFGENWTCSVFMSDNLLNESDWNNATLTISSCGDGNRTGSEICEGDDLNGTTCVLLGYDRGTLSCSDTCTFVETQCVTDGGGGGGGGGGGDEPPEPPDCTYKCTAWDPVVCPASGSQSRSCSCSCDSCSGDSSESRTCDYEESCDDGILNQGEEDTDCGGPCSPCAECEDDDDCGDDYECESGECVPEDECDDDDDDCDDDDDEPEEEEPQEVPVYVTEESEEYVNSVKDCMGYVDVVTENIELTREDLLSAVPEGYEVIEGPFRMSCTDGRMDTSLVVPTDYTEIQILRCKGDECFRAVSVTTESLKCGEEMVRNERTGEYVAADELKFEIDKAEIQINESRKAVSSGKYKVELLTDTDVSVTISTPKKELKQPESTALKIISTPIVLAADRQFTGLDVKITVPYVSDPEVDKDSPALYVKIGERWEYIGGDIVEKLGVITAELDLGEYLKDGEAEFAIIAQICENCEFALLTKVYEPPVDEKVAVVMVHGLGSSPATFVEIINDIRITQQPWQAWTFGYPSKLPTLENAIDLAEQLEANREQYDDIYIAAHSLGGVITQKALRYAYEENKKDSKRYRFIKDVRKVVLVGTPNDKLEPADILKTLMNHLANKVSYGVFDAESQGLMELLGARETIPQVPGVDYYVIAGTRPYEFNIAGLQVTSDSFLSEDNDGIVTVSSAQHVGESVIDDLCSNYWEIDETHTDLLDNPASRVIIEKIIAEQVAKWTKAKMKIGQTQYIELRYDDCSPDDHYIVVGKKIAEEKVYDVTGCSCGNGFCGEGEDVVSCPSDCANILREEIVAPVLNLLILLFFITFISFGLIGGTSITPLYRRKGFTLAMISAGAILICLAAVDHILYDRGAFMLGVEVVLTVVLSFVLARLLFRSFRKYSRGEVNAYKQKVIREKRLDALEKARAEWVKKRRIARGKEAVEEVSHKSSLGIRRGVRWMLHALGIRKTAREMEAAKLLRKQKAIEIAREARSEALAAERKRQEHIQIKRIEALEKARKEWLKERKLERQKLARKKAKRKLERKIAGERKKAAEFVHDTALGMKKGFREAMHSLGLYKTAAEIKRQKQLNALEKARKRLSKIRSAERAAKARADEEKQRTAAISEKQVAQKKAEEKERKEAIRLEKLAAIDLTRKQREFAAEQRKIQKQRKKEIEEELKIQKIQEEKAKELRRKEYRHNWYLKKKAEEKALARKRHLRYKIRSVEQGVLHALGLRKTNKGMLEVAMKEEIAAENAVIAQAKALAAKGHLLAYLEEAVFELESLIRRSQFTSARQLYKKIDLMYNYLEESEKSMIDGMLKEAYKKIR